MYSIKPLSDGSYDILEVDRRAIPGDDNPPMPRVPAPPPASGAPSTAAADTNNVIELLLYYTTAPEARSRICNISSPTST